MKGSMRLAVALGAFLAAGLLQEARAAGCEEAWYQRNLVYKQNGYCFRTPRAIRAFGNAGCTYDSIEDVPLSARERRSVAQFRAYERSMVVREVLASL